MVFLATHLALVAATLFTGAAIYVNVAEHPARMQLADGPALAQWKPSYHAATRLQVSFAIASVIFALVALVATGDWRWSVGALLMLANLPYTFLRVMPTNRVLEATDIARADAMTRQRLQSWNRMHAVRSGLGFAAIIAYVWALS